MMKSRCLGEKPNQKSPYEAARCRAGTSPFASFKPENEALFVRDFDRAARFSHHFAEIDIFPRPVVQPKLVVGSPGGKYEQEADRVAEQVVRMKKPCPRCGIDSEEDDDIIRERPISSQITHPFQQKWVEEDAAITPIAAKTTQTEGHSSQICPRLESKIRSLRGNGQTLSESDRAFFEPRFSYDFSHVRVHTDDSAAKLARAINANAFTTGQDIFFSHGKYIQNNSNSQKLIAHELVHIIQQTKINNKNNTHLQRTIGDGHDLASQRFSGDTTLEACYDGERHLSIGDRGPAVEKVQQALIDDGFLLPIYGVDGKFGSETKSAVENFQRSLGLAGPNVDGIVGPITIGSLDAHFAPVSTTPPPASTGRCNSAIMQTRTVPVFFPRESKILQIFAGTRKLSKGATGSLVGLIQQALVDLCYDLGNTGRNSDGVDMDFGPITEQAIENFQTDESIAAATPGLIDQATIKCLDEARAHETVPCHQVGIVPESQFQVGGESHDGSDEDIFFERGSAVLDSEDNAKIGRLAAAHRGCALTLKGFISEDERLDFGDLLAMDRLNAVDARFAAEGHDLAGVCTPLSPAITLRTLQPEPAASAGMLTYRGQRKVEIIPPGGASSTPICSGPGAIDRNRPLDESERPILAAAINNGLNIINTAYSKLAPGNAEGDNALTAFFSSPAQRNIVKGKLRIWRRHLEVTVGRRNQRGTECNADCSNSIAYNSGVGGSAMMTVCNSFFEPLDLYPGLTNEQMQALIIIHEANHGSLDTSDYAYDTDRLIHFIGHDANLALKNTDSYVSFVRSLSGLLPGGILPPRSDTLQGMNPDEERNAQEGVAWLQSWLTWAEQDVNGLYSTMDESRRAGRWTNLYYGESVLNPFIAAFNIHRPRNALPTMREQTTVAAIWDRYQVMERVTGSDLVIEKEINPSALQRWEPGSGLSPGTTISLNDTYFSLTTPRTRVEMLLPMIVEATPYVDAVLQPAYVTFVKETIRLNWDNHP